MKNKLSKLAKSIINYLLEIIFLVGIALVSIGIFMIGVIPGLISTGVMLVILSFLIGGD
ncbi:MAG TPA: hypothetical protein VK982_02270 [Bacteroidales bacterium]|nr:hypothetical protein [Bacteroidales bacterium]